MRLGALEAGGTKMVCAVGNEYGEILEQTVIPTEAPQKTMPEIIQFFTGKSLDAIGVGCFGPIELDRNNKKYGYITSTPKAEWKDYPMVPTLMEGLRCPVGFDTDVNSSVLGESVYGQAKGKKRGLSHDRNRNRGRNSGGGTAPAWDASSGSRTYSDACT